MNSSKSEILQSSFNQILAQIMSKTSTSDVLEMMIEYLDGKADLAHLSNAKKDAEFYRQLVVYLFEAWKKVGAIEELKELK